MYKRQFLVYQICVLSWPPQEITGLLPFFLFPVCVIRLAGLPLGYLLQRALWLLPVAVMIGIFNPLVAVSYTHLDVYKRQILTTSTAHK